MSFAHWVATGFLLLCPLAVSFVPSPTQQQQPSRLPSHTPLSNVVATAKSATTTTQAASASTRATELAAADRGAGRANGAGVGGGAGATGKPPRSVLERPWDVEVDFHGERRVITVQPGDSILEAAEMSGMNLSYECRRGNCISCAAKVQDGSSGHFENKADRGSEDGAPDGFVLTCSTHPTGPGVKLDLSANAEMWKAYCAKFDDIVTQDLLRKASAAIMRKYREEHPNYFREEVEGQFKKPTT
eukprot:g7345.t1